MQSVDITFPSVTSTVTCVTTPTMTTVISGAGLSTTSMSAIKAIEKDKSNDDDKKQK